MERAARDLIQFYPSITSIGFVLVGNELKSTFTFSDKLSNQLLSGLSSRQVHRQDARLLLGVFNFLSGRHGHSGRCEYFRRSDGSAEEHSEGNIVGDTSHHAVVFGDGDHGWRCNGARCNRRCCEPYRPDVLDL